MDAEKIKSSFDTLDPTGKTSHTQKMLAMEGTRGLGCSNIGLCFSMKSGIHFDACDRIMYAGLLNHIPAVL